MSVSFLYPFSPIAKFPSVRRAELVNDDPVPVDVGTLVERNARARTEWWYRLATGSRPIDLRDLDLHSRYNHIEFRRYRARRWLKKLREDREQSHLRASSLSNVTFFPPLPRPR